MDKIDLQILKLLHEDSRLPSTEIARLIGTVTPQVVRYRIDRLLQKKIFLYVTIIDFKTLGFLVQGDIFIKVKPNHVLNIGRKLSEFDQVSYVGYSTRDQHVSITVRTRNNEELFYFATQIIGNLPEVITTRTIAVPVMLKHVADWQIPGNGDKDLVFSEKNTSSSSTKFQKNIDQFDIDHIDQSIIKKLQRNARISGENISQTLNNVSGRVVRYRIDRLIEKGVIRPSIIIIPKAVGYTWIGEVFIEVKPGKTLDVGKEIAELQEVGYVGCSIGGHELSIQIYGRSESDIRNIIYGVIKKIPGVANVSKVFIIRDILKIYSWKF